MSEGGRVEGGSGLGGVAWRGAGSMLSGQVVRMVLQLASVAVLSRLLSPRDYGLLAMGLVVVAFGEVFRDFGLSTAALQAPSLDRSQRDALCLLSLAIGLGFAVILVLAAPLVALLFQEPELVAMYRVLALIFVVNGLASQYRAHLNRDLRFKAMVVADVAGQVVGLVVAIVIAVLGGSYWSLVGQQLTAAGVGLAIVMIQCRWLPRWPRRGTKIASLVKFGSGLSASYLVGYFINNVDNIIIGTQLGPVSLGYYSRGYQLVQRVAGQFRGSSIAVAVPVLSRLAGDHARADGYLVRGQAALGYTLIAGLGFAAGASTPIVEIMLGPGWGQVAPVFALLAISAAFDTGAYVGYWVYLSRALTAQLVWYNLVSLAVRGVAVLIGAQWGIVGVAAGMAVATGICWPISLGWLSRLTHLPTRRIYAGAFRILTLAVLVGGGAYAGVWLARDVPSALVSLLVALAGGTAGYGLGMLVMPATRREVVGLIASVRRGLARRTPSPEAG